MRQSVVHKSTTYSASFDPDGSSHFSKAFHASKETSDEKKTVLAAWSKMVAGANILIALPDI